MNQLALDIGLSLKSAGQLAVTEGTPWAEAAILAMQRYVSQLEHGARFAIEDFRHWALSRGEIDPPHHPNAWGAITPKAESLGVIRWTGEYRPARSAATHAHPVRVYVRGEV